MLGIKKPWLNFAAVLSVFLLVLVLTAEAQRGTGGRSVGPLLGPESRLIGPVEGTERQKSPGVIAFEGALGITVELSTFHHGEPGNNPIRYLHITSIDPGSRIAASGVQVGDIVSFIEIGGIQGTGRAEWIRSFQYVDYAEQVDVFELTFSRDFRDAIVATVSDLSVKHPDGNFVSGDLAPQVQRSTNLPFNAPGLQQPSNNPTVLVDTSACASGQQTTYVVLSEAERDDAARRNSGLRYAAATKGCLGQDSVENTVHLYMEDGEHIEEYVYVRPNLMPVTLRDRISGDNFSRYRFGPLLKLLANERLDMAMLEIQRERRPYHMFYYFAFRYGETCIPDSAPRDRIVQSTVETVTGWGYQDSEVVDQDVRFVEAGLGQKVVDIGERYVYGLAAGLADRDVRRLFDTHSCDAEIIQNIRRTLKHIEG